MSRKHGKQMCMVVFASIIVDICVALGWLVNSFILFLYTFLTTSLISKPWIFTVAAVIWVYKKLTKVVKGWEQGFVQ